MSPQIKIPAHVLGYSMALFPAVAYAFYYQRNKPSDEEFEKVLAKNYSHSISNSTGKRNDVVKMVDAVRGGAQSEDFDKVLKGGKGDMKRNYPLDKALYGTTEGIKKRNEMEKLQKEGKLKKKRLEKQVEKETSKATKIEEPVSTTSKQLQRDNVDQKLVVSVALVVGTAAAAVGYVIGGRRS